jgi:HK97 family phage prohead protease
MNIETKRIAGIVTVKGDGGADAGEVEAIFSRFDVIDSDNDIVLASAFTHGQEVPMTLGHDWTRIVGKGRIMVEPGQAVLNGQYFMDTTAGKEAFLVVKGLENLAEWSWGFKTTDAAYEQRGDKTVRVIKAAEVYEVSQVLKGAGVGTYTRDLKGNSPDEKPYPAEHACRLKEPSEFQPDSFRRTSRESDGKRYDVIMGKLKGESSMTEQAYRYPRDVWSEAQAKAHCSDHEGITFEPAASESGLTYAEHAEQALAACKAFMERSQSLANLRAKEGRVLSTANRERLATLLDALSSVAKDIKELLDSTAPEPAKSARAQQLYAEYLKIMARLNGVAA